MSKSTATFEIEDVGVWEIPWAVATTIEGLADQRVAFLARAERAEAEVERLREQVATLTAEEKRITKALVDLFDAHYGTSYHHCGDGDGLSSDEAAEIVFLVRRYHTA